MKIEDLMVNDWVIIKGGILKDCPAILTEVHELELASGYKPIQLTEEILNANGFDKKQLDDSFLYSKEVGNYCIVFFSENGCPYLTIEDVEDIDEHHTCVELKDEVYNVHELQHALRLCGMHELADNFKIK